MDSFALGLKIADRLISDGRLDEFVRERYSSYKSGIGAKIVSKTATIEELEKHALSLGEITTNTSGRQEYLESIVNSVIFG